MFHDYRYRKSVREDIELGTDLLQVTARSTDTGLNNVIRYRISNGGANNQLFTIHPVTGMYSLCKPLYLSSRCLTRERLASRL